MFKNSLLLLRTSFLPIGRHFYATSSSSEFVKIVRHDSEQRAGLVELCLNRVQAKNALSRKFADQILENVNEIHSDQHVKCVLIRSLDKDVFCAGADLKERLTLSAEEVPNSVRVLRHFMNRIEQIPVPVIAVLDGHALGGGLEMALACDLRIASSNVKIGLVETKWAIIPGAGGTHRLPRLIGIAAAKELIYTARIITASEAKSYNLINHLVEQNSDKNASYLKALEIAEAIIQNGPIAIKMAKLAIDKGLQVGFDAGMTLVDLCYANVVDTEDRIEGLKSFSGKYKAKYKGK